MPQADEHPPAPTARPPRRLGAALWRLGASTRRLAQGLGPCASRPVALEALALRPGPDVQALNDAPPAGEPADLARLRRRLDDLASALADGAGLDGGGHQAHAPVAERRPAPSEREDAAALPTPAFEELPLPMAGNGLEGTARAMVLLVRERVLGLLGGHGRASQRPGA